MKFQLENVSFSYKSKALRTHQVFAKIDLTIESGECVAIVGEGGSGKSTLLQLLNGLQRPDVGRVLVERNDIWKNSRQLHRVRRKIGFAFQFPEQQFFCETVKDELLFAWRNFAPATTNMESKSIAALAELGVDAKVLPNSPFSLSMGEARRISLASLLVLQPESFLLDEPTAGLDAFGSAAVQSLMIKLNEQAKTIVFASHDRDLVQAIASRVITLVDGSVKSDVPVLH